MAVRDRRTAAAGSPPRCSTEADVRARELRARRGSCSRAQLTRAALYERAGYAPYGDVFLDAGIEHVAMEKHL